MLNVKMHGGKRNTALGWKSQAGFMEEGTAGQLGLGGQEDSRNHRLSELERPERSFGPTLCFDVETEAQREATTGPRSQLKGVGEPEPGLGS